MEKAMQSKASTGRLSARLKTLTLPLALLTSAIVLTGCAGTSPAPSARGIRGILGDDLLSAKGSTRDDQRKIDKTLEAGISAGIWQRP